jgi:hypothetical protein
MFRKKPFGRSAASPPISHNARNLKEGSQRAPLALRIDSSSHHQREVALKGQQFARRHTFGKGHAWGYVHFEPR